MIFSEIYIETEGKIFELVWLKKESINSITKHKMGNLENNS
jgi:hypothetical protein